jgi:hypothetical protein
MSCNRFGGMAERFTISTIGRMPIVLLMAIAPGEA